MPNRGEAAGIFIAVLDRVRRKLATVQQAEDFSEIYVSARADAPDEALAPSQAEQLAEPAAMKADEVRIGPDGLPHVVPAYKVKRGAFHGCKRSDEEPLTEAEDGCVFADGRPNHDARVVTFDGGQQPRQRFGW